VIDYSLSDDEEAVVEAARQVAQSDDPWRGLVDGGWLDLLLDDDGDATPLGFLGFVAEEMGYAGVSSPLPGSAALWPTLFQQSCAGKRVGVVRSDYCEDGAGAELVVVRPDGYDDFDVEPLGGLEGDGLARVTRLGTPIATTPDEDALAPLAMQRAIALVCSEMAGLMRRVLDMTLAHLATREQFGQPLSSFQVIQHGAARLATMAEGATWGARLVTHDLTRQNVHGVKGWLSSTAQEASALAHQLHGAIGFTEEYGLQLLTKRLRTLRFAWGDDRHHHEALGILSIS